MSRIKEHYHEEISKGLNQDNHIDDEVQYQEFLDKQEAEALELRAEEAKFLEIFQLTGTYPM